MKTLILDYSKWRCGEYSENKLGVGKTALLNDEGFMCCLGQFGLQLNPALTECDIKGEGEPGDLKCYITLLSQENDEGRYISTNLSVEAIDINDKKETTPEVKIELLKKLFGEYDCEIEVINNPENITNA